MEFNLKFRKKDSFFSFFSVRFFPISAAKKKKHDWKVRALYETRKTNIVFSIDQIRFFKKVIPGGNSVVKQTFFFSSKLGTTLTVLFVMVFAKSKSKEKKVITVSTVANECRWDLDRTRETTEPAWSRPCTRGRPARIQTFFHVKFCRRRPCVARLRGGAGVGGWVHACGLPLKSPLCFFVLPRHAIYVFFVQVNVIVPGHLAAALSASIERLIIMWCIEFFTVPTKRAYVYPPHPLLPLHDSRVQASNTTTRLLHFIITQLPFVNLSLTSKWCLYSFTLVSYEKRTKFLLRTRETHFASPAMIRGHGNQRGGGEVGGLWSERRNQATWRPTRNGHLDIFVAGRSM